MIGIILVILFIFFIFIGVPIAYSIGTVALIGIMSIPNISNVTVPMKMFYGLNSFVLLAVPLFILSANLMNSGNISKKLIDLSVALMGSLKGGLAYANVLVSMIFAGVSGSSTADTAGIGKILIPRMLEDGYDKENSVGITAASSTIGSIIPPSIIMVIFGGITNTPISDLFLAGIVPGVLIGLGMMGVIWFNAKKRNYPSYNSDGKKNIFKLFIEAIPALLTPIIIIGGIVTGWYTATEAAAFAALYSLFVGMFIYKAIKLSDIPHILVDTLKLSSLSLFALATSSALGELLGYYNVNTILQTFFMNNFTSQILFMLIIVLFFLFIGTFMDAIPAMILFVPIMMPTVASIGIPNVVFGIVIVITLATGLVTPPYGLCLLIASSIGDLSIEKSFKGVIPYIGVIMVVLLLIIVYPQTALFIIDIFK